MILERKAMNTEQVDYHYPTTKGLGKQTGRRGYIATSI